MSSKSSVPSRKTYNSNIYKYHPSKGNSIFCVICFYRYRKDAPFSTPQEHLRIKHGFSIRNPPTPMAMRQQIREAKKERGLLDNDTDFDLFKSNSTRLIDSITTSRISINALLNPDPTSLEEAIANWVSNEGIPLSSILSPGFQQIIQICNSSLVVPSETRLGMLTLKRYASNISQFPKPRFRPLPQYTISASVDSYLRDSSRHRINYDYEGLFDLPDGLENYQKL